MDADLKHLLGQRGTVTTADTAAVVGDFSAIQILADAVFTAVSEEAATGSLLVMTHPADRILFGRFTGYTLASGTVRAYAR